MVTGLKAARRALETDWHPASFPACTAGLHWQDAEIVSESSGRPLFELRGSVRARADELGVASVHVSLSHDAGIASAVVVLES